MLANIVWDGGPTGTGTDFFLPANWVGNIRPGIADTAIIDTAGPTIVISGAATITAFHSSRDIRLDNNSGPLAVLTTTGTNIMSASLLMGGGWVIGGTWNFNGADHGFGNSGFGCNGAITDATINGDVWVGGLSLTIVGSTTFSAARMNYIGYLSLPPGYVLNSTIIVEGPNARGTIGIPPPEQGTVTFGPTAVVRATGGAYNLQIGGYNGHLINYGLISADALGSSLTFNGFQVENRGVINAGPGVLLDIIPGQFSNYGSVNADSAIVNLTGTWANTGTINVSDTTLNLGGSFNAAGAASSALHRVRGVVNLAGTLDNTANVLPFNTSTGSWNLLGGTVLNGAVSFADGARLVFTTTGGTLNSVVWPYDIVLDSPSQSVTLAGSTTFGDARLLADGVNLQFAAGYTLFSRVFAEGASTGSRNITIAPSPGGVVTFAPAALVQLSSVSAAMLNITGPATSTLINNGLITAQAAARTVTINTGTLINAGSIQLLAGTVRIGAATWTNSGTITAAGGILSLEGTFVTATGIGMFSTGSSIVNVIGTINNANGTILLNAATGPWNIAGGTISGGIVNCAPGVALHATSLGGALNAVAITGEVLLNTASARILLSGATTFAAARLQAAGVNLQMAPAFTLNSLVLAEGVAPGTRLITLAPTANGNITFAAAAVVRLAPDAAANLVIQHGIGGTLTNNGLISAEASDQTLIVSPGSLVNAGSIRALAGSVNLASALTNTGLLSGVTGNLNITGTLNNTGATQNINAAAGTWNFTGGTINNGTINITGGGALRSSAVGGLLNSVLVNGDILVDSPGAFIRFLGSTTATTIHLSSTGASLQIPAGVNFNSTILVEGAAPGNRFITLLYGGSNSFYFGPAAIVRISQGSGGGLVIAPVITATLTSDALFTSEAANQVFSIQATAFANLGTIRTLNGGRVQLDMTAWSNAGTLDIQNGQFTISGTGAFTNARNINIGPGGLVQVNSVGGLVTTAQSVINASIGGTQASTYGRIVVATAGASLAGQLRIAFDGAYLPPQVSTFNIVTLDALNRAITGAFTSTTMPPPGLDGKNFMMNDSRNITFAFSSLADYNNDAVVDFFDYLDFVQDFSIQSGGSDFNHDSTIDFFDYLDFLVIFSRF